MGTNMQCPECDTENVFGLQQTKDGGHTMRTCRCLDCGATWISHDPLGMPPPGGKPEGSGHGQQALVSTRLMKGALSLFSEVHGPRALSHVELLRFAQVLCAAEAIWFGAEAH